MKLNIHRIEGKTSKRNGRNMIRFSFSKIDKDGDIEYTVHGCIYNNQRTVMMPAIPGAVLTPLVEVHPLIKEELKAYLDRDEKIQAWLGPQYDYTEEREARKKAKRSKEEKDKERYEGDFSPGVIDSRLE